MSSSVNTNDSLTTANVESFAYATQLMFGSVLPMALQAAIELGVFEIIAKAGDCAMLSAFEIASQITTRNPNAPMMLDRILVMLASHSVVTCSLIDSKKVYGLTPVAKYFVPDQNGVSLAPTFGLIQGKIYFNCWSQLKEAILEGGTPCERTHGVNLFEYAALDSKFNEDLNEGMINYTTLVINNMLGVYNGFENINQLVDVGGGLGVTLEAITSKYPHIKGINFDLPHVIQHVPHHPGVEIISGNMFESVPKGDAIFLKCILHDWNDDKCLKLLKNCYKSIPDEGKVIVVEHIAPPVAETNTTAKVVFQTDIMMMTVVQEGKERTRDEFMELAIAAGFSGIRFVCSVCIFWVMELYK